VIEAAEDYFALDRCVLRGGPCDWNGACPVHETWSQALTAFADSLAATSLAELAQRDRAIEDGTYEAPESQHIEPTPRRGRRG
jgi:DNA-binding IscR family transcriptional regulator